MSDNSLGLLIMLAAALILASGAAWQIWTGKAANHARWIYRAKEPGNYWFSIGLLATLSLIFFVAFILCLHSNK